MNKNELAILIDSKIKELDTKMNLFKTDPCNFKSGIDVLKTLSDMVINLLDNGSDKVKTSLNTFNKLINTKDFTQQDINAILYYFGKEILTPLRKEIKNNKDIVNTTLVDSYNDFVLTSQETDFQKYNTNLELQRLTNIVKTQDTKIKQYFEYEKTVKGKKIKVKKDGYIIASFQSPLDWIDKTYQLNIIDTMPDKEILERIKTTKCFEITSEQEEIYNAVCELIRIKIKENKNNEVIISFNELHTQLGYDGKLRKQQKDHYENLIYHMSNLHINMELNKVAYANHAEYFKLHGDIKKEPLIIWGGTCKLQTQKNKTSVQLDGFKTFPTNLMRLHFNFTNQFYISNQTKIRSKLPHASKLESCYKRKFFINTGNNNYCIDLKLKTIFDILKEFNLEYEYNQSSNKPQFIKRQILNPLNKMPEIKEAKILNKMIRTYFIKPD